MLLVINCNIDLSGTKTTVAGVQDLSTTSSTLSSFLAFRRLLFLDLPMFYSLIDLVLKLNISPLILKTDDLFWQNNYKKNHDDSRIFI